MTFKCDRCGRYVEGNFYMLALKCIDLNRLHTRDEDITMINGGVLCWECSLEFEREVSCIFRDEEYLTAVKEAKESEEKLSESFYRLTHTKFWRAKMERNDKAIKEYQKKIEEEMENE